MMDSNQGIGLEHRDLCEIKMMYPSKWKRLCPYNPPADCTECTHWIRLLFVDSRKVTIARILRDLTKKLKDPMRGEN